MDLYFNKFPNTYYSNTLVKDITKRATLNPELRNNIELYTPYEVNPNLRADEISHAYYGDSYLDWLIYISNDIVDPYFGWPLTDEQLQNLIISKYTTVELAQEEIKFWRVDWHSHAETEITKSFYDNNLIYVLKKYYTPTYNKRGEIVGYKRKNEEWKVNTNKIIRFTINSSINDTTFEEDEKVSFKYNGEIVGNGNIIQSNSTTITLQHIFGNTTANSTHFMDVIGQSSNAQANCNEIELLVQNIPTDEFIYWEHVTAYDYEIEKNESRKIVGLLNSEYALEASEELRIKFKKITEDID